MGADFFPEGGENVSKVVLPLKNGSRGGDTVCTRRGGVEEGGEGGEDKPTFRRRKNFFDKTLTRIARVFVAK